MFAQRPIDVVLSFVECINAHHVEGLCLLLSEDHLFIDSLGQSVRGREKVREAWSRYLTWFPDYTISIRDAFLKEEAVALFGTASGTYSSQGVSLKENHWEIPAAWKATVTGGLVAEWQVYADNSRVARIINART